MLDGYHFSDLESRYVNITGDFMTGALGIENQLEIHLYQNDSVNPMLIFHNQDRVWGNLTYRHDNIFHFVNANVSTGTDYRPLKASGFIKSDSSDYYLLRGGGGHFRLSDTFVYRGENLIANWNDISDNGSIRISNQTITNGPSGAYNYGQLLTFNAGGTLSQIYLPHSAAQSMYIRTGWSGVSQYYGWIQMLSTENYSQTLDSRYVLKSGDTITGLMQFTNRIRICGTPAVPAWNSIGSITWTEAANSDNQAVSIAYTSWDSYREPAGLKVVGNQGNEWFEAPRFIKTGSSDSYVLLGGGGHILKGNGSGNIPISNGTICTNLNADKLDNCNKESFESYYGTYIDARNLDQNTWYPVTMDIGNSLRTRIRVEGNTEAPASWNNRTDKRMSLYLDYDVNGSAWGWTQVFRVVYATEEGAGTNHCIGGVGQLINSSTEYVYVRGGAAYMFYTSRFITPILRTSTYTIYEQSIAPTTSPVWVTRNNALISDNVASATQLQYARTFYINSYIDYDLSAGTNFDGTSNVTLRLPSSIVCSNWFRSKGATGWFNEDYWGGIYMEDSTWVRTYGGKRFYVNNGESNAIYTEGAYKSNRHNATVDSWLDILNPGNACFGNVLNAYIQPGEWRPMLGWCDTMSGHGYVTRYSIGSHRVAGEGWGKMYLAVGNNDSGTSAGVVLLLSGNGYAQVEGNLYATGAMTAKSSGSDIRLKKDIQSYKAMDIINKFRSVKYHWNDIAKANSEVYNNDYDQFGLIAQDLLAGGYQQWVKDVFKDYYTIEYERLIPVVWKGLQEVDSEVDKLKKRVEILERENEMLKRRIPA